MYAVLSKISSGQHGSYASLIGWFSRRQLKMTTNFAVYTNSPSSFICSWHSVGVCPNSLVSIALAVGDQAR